MSQPSISEYFTLGRSGLRVSRLSLGVMTFGTEWGWGSDKAAAQSIFDHYVEAGGNFIDTADAYTNGTSEKWLGEFVRARGLRDHLVLATKFTFNLGERNANKSTKAVIGVAILIVLSLVLYELRSNRIIHTSSAPPAITQMMPATA